MRCMMDGSAVGAFCQAPPRAGELGSRLADRFMRTSEQRQGDAHQV